jgi:hypothetical protein
MIYTTGYRDTTPMHSVTYGVRAFCCLIGTATLMMLADLPWINVVQSIFETFALIFFCVALVLAFACILEGYEERRKDREEWESIGETAGYRYDQNRVDPNVRRAKFVVLGEKPRPSDYPINRRWLDEGGEFNPADLQFELR